MNTNNTKHLGQSATYAVVASGTILSLLFTAFFLVEPVISHGAADTDEFIVQQVISNESSFLVRPADITMDGTIAGLTGGQSTGTAQFVVQSNNSSGYYVEIDFFDNSTPEAMLGDDTASESIRDYSGSTMEPSFNFTASTAAQFAYTVVSSSTNLTDTDVSFKDDGAGACNNGGTNNGKLCWMGPSTTAFRIVDRSTAAVSGATSTVYFSVVVPSGAVPVPVAETYTATVTLSLFEK